MYKRLLSISDKPNEDAHGYVGYWRVEKRNASGISGPITAETPVGTTSSADRGIDILTLQIGFLID